jgi:hypothetical protein
MDMVIGPAEARGWDGTVCKTGFLTHGKFIVIDAKNAGMDLHPESTMERKVVPSCHER